MAYLFRTATLLTLLAVASGTVIAEPTRVTIGYLQWLPDQGPVLSNVIQRNAPQEFGLQ